MSECEKRLGDWRVFNPLRDSICAALGISVEAPVPTVPAVAAAPTFPAVSGMPPEVAVTQVVTVKPGEAQPVQPEIIVSAPAEVEVTVEDWRRFEKQGDVNLNGIVDQDDLDEVKRCFGQSQGSRLWPVCAKCDLDGDGKVDARDVAIASANQGLTIYKWKKSQS